MSHVSELEAARRLAFLMTKAAEVVELRPDVILAAVTPAAVATAALTKSIPIVCPLLADAINLGLVASEARPGANVTGVSFRTQGLTSKQVELALQMIKPSWPLSRGSILCLFACSFEKYHNAFWGRLQAR